MKRILLVRTDKIGDLILSTPAIKALRGACPQAFIAIMVTPYTKDVVDANPYLDEVVIFDKKVYKGVIGSIRFASILKNKKFDTAIVLHPVKRVHIVLWLAGIKKRIGLNRKWGFLLTERIPHRKQLGEKHEAEYTIDVLKAAGLNIVDTGKLELFVPVKKEAFAKVQTILESNGLAQDSGFVVISPGATSGARRWPPERFARAADEIIDKFQVKIAVVGSAAEKALCQQIASSMKNKPLDLCGVLSVAELAALIDKSRLLISNISGPAHIAAALNVPVVVIFSMKEPGLVPRRWKPLGEKSIVLYKDVGCAECLAHNCRIGFKCLMAIEPTEVVEAAGKLLR